MSMTSGNVSLAVMSPSLRGSGLKFRRCISPAMFPATSPSLRGSGLKSWNK